MIAVIHVPRPDALQTETRSERTLQAIRGIPMFRGLAPVDQQRLAALATLRDYGRGDFLWRAGDPAEHLTVVVRGRVKIVGHSAGSDVILELFGPGEPVGAIAVYNYIPYPASAVAMESCTILVLPRRDYFELLDRHPEFARAIIRDLTKMVLSLTRKLEEMRGQRIEVRIAQLFLNLSERMGRPGKGGAVEIPIALSRQEVADLVGTTVETAIRVLSRWGREGVLVTGEKRFLLPSKERLLEIAEGRSDGKEGR
ncbi:MAG TPA: Crp/Fnr family transcriptional regulator [Candidatus Eisenbacteria bacterium]|nr:Crp/Fnr family transcriptional regulator [Candidatus Eisenbacteria bacterium]